MVEFEDNFDNDSAGQGTCEVLYVTDLVLGAGSIIRLGDCNVYYQCLTAHPTATIETPGLGSLTQVGTCQVAGGSTIAAMDPMGEILLAILLAATGVWWLRRSRMRPLPG